MLNSEEPKKFWGIHLTGVNFASKGGSAKVAPSWADVRVVSAAWEEQPLGSGS
jgi:hypothetical protein